MRRGRERGGEERGEEGEITCLNIRDADVHGARVCAVEQERTSERERKEP